MRIGSGCFSVNYKRQENQVSVGIKNNNQFRVTAEYNIILDTDAESEEITLSGAKYTGDIGYGKFLGKTTIKITTTLDKGDEKNFKVAYSISDRK